MSVSELCTFRTNSEPGAVLRCRSFQKARWCMAFLADPPTLIRWCGYGYYRLGTSKEGPMRPYLPRHFRSQRGCYGFGMDENYVTSKRVRPQVVAKGLSGFSFSYKVREGDTLTSVANKFKVSIQAIATFNEIVDVDYIPAGKILLIPQIDILTGEGVGKADRSSNFVESQTCEGKSVVLRESSLSAMPACASAFCVQSWHVKLALSLLLLLAFSSSVRRYISGLKTRRHDEFVQMQVEKEVQEAHHQPKLRRWQGILDDDRRVNEVDGDGLGDSGAVLDAEDESLRQTYAQLESAYIKFLADSGLSKSGYWRGGVPPAFEEK